MDISVSRIKLKALIRAVQTEADFNRAALAVFEWQREYNPVYAKWLHLLGRFETMPLHWSEIPCAPIGIFKWFEVQTGSFSAKQIFSSSGTTGSNTSKHHVLDVDWYQEVSIRLFENQFGPLRDYGILALLPSYLERQDSSLVAMTRFFMEHCGYPEHSGFFLQNHEALLQQAKTLQAEKAKILLLGVSFALVDLAALQPDSLSNALIMETGGMKGRRRELTREELHDLLKNGFNAPQIASEYGMTELLSQAYAPTNGRFMPAPTLRVWAREPSNPLEAVGFGKTGVLNIVDLANIDSCAFLASDDLGRVQADGSFEVLGRSDNSDMRGCNLLVM